MYIYWPVISKEMDQYIRYHKKPYANYLDVKAFNKKYGTDIPEVEHYDEYFHATFTQAKQMQGPDDFLQVKFATHDEFKDMSFFGGLKAQASKLFNQGKGAVQSKRAKMKKAEILKLLGLDKNGDINDGERVDQLSKADKAKYDKLKKEYAALVKSASDAGSAAEAAKAKEKEEYDKSYIAKKGREASAAIKKKLAKKKELEENDLDALLSDDEDILEAEYDETEAPVTNIVTEKKQITDLVKASSSDTKAFEQDMKYLIQFKNAKFPLRDQLMKGRPKYMKALKSYVKGDNKAEVKMSWKEGKNKMVKVASLNPDIKSLRAILRQTPGTLRIVECL